MIGTLEYRLAGAILELVQFSSDDITGNGQIAVDGRHTPNGRQNAIGSLFRRHHAAGHIEPTGRTIRSRAPHRRGGAIAVCGVPAAILDRVLAPGTERLVVAE